MAVTHLSDGNPDGSTFGQNSTDLISFYGATPVARPSAITTVAVTTPVSTLQSTAINSIITTLQTLGLTA